MKLLTGCGVLLHWRQPSHRTLYKVVVDTLPHFLSGEDIGYSREVQQAIAKYYRKHLVKKKVVKLRSVPDSGSAA
jgi:hypothetical protein